MTDSEKKLTDRILEEIAQKQLGVETLETRGSDRLDFHDVGVAGLKAALELAFKAGRESAGLID